MNIDDIKVRQIFDSRGYPTLECDVLLSDGSVGRASTPSGASTGSGEAVELRDDTGEYNGKGVSKAIANVREQIAPALKGYDAYYQKQIDDIILKLDGTDNKQHLGGNATIAVSLAVAHAAAVSKHVPLYEHLGALIGNATFNLPMPMFNILNGGKHAEGSTDIQEFMIVPIGADSINKALQMASEVYHVLGSILKVKGYATTVGDEGGYAPSVKGGTEEALDSIMAAISQAGYKPGKDIALALDVAASELSDENGYNFAREQKKHSSDQLIDYYDTLATAYPLVSLEDGLSESDWSGWEKLNQRLGHRLQLVADDLLVTNPKLLHRAIESKAANAILIKPNQIGTLSETLEAISIAKQANWRTVISHRSGETEDIFIAHLAVGTDSGQIKTGSFARSERVAKYNELIRISELLPNPVLSHVLHG